MFPHSVRGRVPRFDGLRRIQFNEMRFTRRFTEIMALKYVTSFLKASLRSSPPRAASLVQETHLSDRLLAMGSATARVGGSILLYLAATTTTHSNEATAIHPGLSLAIDVIVRVPPKLNSISQGLGCPLSLGAQVILRLSPAELDIEH